MKRQNFIALMVLCATLFNQPGTAYALAPRGLPGPVSPVEAELALRFQTILNAWREGVDASRMREADETVQRYLKSRGQWTGKIVVDFYHARPMDDWRTAAVLEFRVRRPDGTVRKMQGILLAKAGRSRVKQLATARRDEFFVSLVC